MKILNAQQELIVFCSVQLLDYGFISYTTLSLFTLWIGKHF